jgi:hypothetical protein
LLHTSNLIGVIFYRRIHNSIDGNKNYKRALRMHNVYDMPF